MRISDWSSDVCSSDLRPRITAPKVDRLLQPGPAGGGACCVGGHGVARLVRRWKQIVIVRDAPDRLAGGVATVRAEHKDTPPQPSPALAGEGDKARAFRRSYRGCSRRACRTKAQHNSAPSGKSESRSKSHEG